MGSGHVHALYVHGESPLHRVAPQCKVLGLVLFVLAVTTTPREAFWVFGLDAVVLVAVAAYGHLRFGTVTRRLLIEVPFLLFALLLPVVGQDPRIDVLGVSLSSEGLWAAWNIIIKGTLGVGASVIVAATTPVPEMLQGLDRLHLPRVFTAIAGFMVRYLDLAALEMGRMSVARQSRGYDPRWIWQVRAIASSAGTLFIRSYERGERVYLAMSSRGYDGTLPVAAGIDATRSQWVASMAVPAVAALASLTAWTVLR